jgi:hypothetical protein
VEEHGIPAACIGSVDLAKVAETDPITAAEIARLHELMQDGDSTDGDFRNLIRLMHDAGYPAEAEYLLRRGISGAEEAVLYASLFGSRIPDEFGRAIGAFATEFGVALQFADERCFLDRLYESLPSGRTTSRHTPLHQPCTVRFTFDRRDCVTAEVTTVEAEERRAIQAYDLTAVIFLRWQSGRWRLIDWRDA